MVTRRLSPAVTFAAVVLFGLFLRSAVGGPLFYKMAAALILFVVALFALVTTVVTISDNIRERRAAKRQAANFAANMAVREANERFWREWRERTAK